jgi:hypothetical protein
MALVRRRHRRYFAEPSYASSVQLKRVRLWRGARPLGRTPR